jgi:hypothetical protein
VDTADNLAGFLRNCGKSLFQLDVVGEIQRIGGLLLYNPELLLQFGHAFNVHASRLKRAKPQYCSILNTIGKARLAPEWLSLKREVYELGFSIAGFQSKLLDGTNAPLRPAVLNGKVGLRGSTDFG